MLNHRRNGMSRIHKIRLIALVPVVAVAIVNTGYQYLLALNTTDASSTENWQVRLLQGMGTDTGSPGIYQICLAGMVFILPQLIVAMVTAGLWERIFSDSRQQTFDTGIVFTALLFTLLMPATTSLFHVFFAMTFAIVIGKAVFGGEGKSFLNPALVGVMVVQISFSGWHSSHPLWISINGYAGANVFSRFQIDGFDHLASTNVDLWTAIIGNYQGLAGTTSVIAIVLGGIILIYGRIASWRLILGQILGVFVAAELCNLGAGGMSEMPWFWHLVLGSFAFGAIFIATDPASSASTNSGRWVQGLLIGMLIVFIRTFHPSHPDGVVSVLMLASMMAPLIDHVFCWFNIRRRTLRNA